MVQIKCCTFFKIRWIKIYKCVLFIQILTNQSKSVLIKKWQKRSLSPRIAKGAVVVFPTFAGYYFHLLFFFLTVTKEPHSATKKLSRFSQYFFNSDGIGDVL